MDLNARLKFLLLKISVKDLNESLKENEKVSNDLEQFSHFSRRMVWELMCEWCASGRQVLRRNVPNGSNGPHSSSVPKASDFG